MAVKKPPKNRVCAERIDQYCRTCGQKRPHKYVADGPNLGEITYKCVNCQGFVVKDAIWFRSNGKN